MDSSGIRAVANLTLFPACGLPGSAPPRRKPGKKIKTPAPFPRSPMHPAITTLAMVRSLSPFKGLIL